MDKQTLSNYGWVIITVLVLAVMIALATPFGTYISNGVKSTTQGLFDVEKNAINNLGLTTIKGQSFKEGVAAKAENNLGILNYYEVAFHNCHCFDSQGGYYTVIGEEFEKAGMDITQTTLWSDLLANEKLADMLTAHTHGVGFFEYECADGMTWEEFINSSACNGDFAIHTDGSIYCAMQGVSYGHFLGKTNVDKVYADEVINKNIAYAIGAWEIGD